MGKKSFPEASYFKLLKEIKEEISQGLSRAQTAYDREKIITYWKVGQAISKHLRNTKTSENDWRQLLLSLIRELRQTTIHKTFT
ncbi:MAG: hypothetical protein KKF54_03785 [Candidatus Omnitrophica bacterium]|nr:hypothetical protein [Candidatus Omnitrophota bacterium]